jgi:hypothetical protein
MIKQMVESADQLLQDDQGSQFKKFSTWNDTRTLNQFEGYVQLLYCNLLNLTYPCTHVTRSLKNRTSSWFKGDPTPSSIRNWKPSSILLRKSGKLDQSLMFSGGAMKIWVLLQIAAFMTNRNFFVGNMLILTFESLRDVRELFGLF